MLRLAIVIASTRPGRTGPAVTEWFASAARAHGGFEVAVEDLADYALPVFDEPNHPRMQAYTKDHTKAWSAAVDAADAFVIVTPEYNFGPTPAMLNAFTYLSKEWNRKPVAFVSYGGVSGGIRGVQALKPILATANMATLPQQVTIPFVANQMKDGKFEPSAANIDAVAPMLDELKLWAGALKTIR